MAETSVFIRTVAHPLLHVKCHANHAVYTYHGEARPETAGRAQQAEALFASRMYFHRADHPGSRQPKREAGGEAMQEVTSTATNMVLLSSAGVPASRGNRAVPAPIQGGRRESAMPSMCMSEQRECVTHI